MPEIRTSGKGLRLDKLLSEEGLSRSRAAKLVEQGLVTVNGKTVLQPSFIPKPGDEVLLLLPETKEGSNLPQDIPIQLLYEDESLAVVNKPSGLVVHPAPGNPDGTLVNALLYHLTSLSSIGGEQRPGIVHRLDKDTSGLMLVAKNDFCHQKLSRALSDREIDKRYLALAYGKLSQTVGEIDLPIGRNPKDRKKMAVVPDGRQALTRYMCLEDRASSSLLLLHILTGRTHQIRVHLRALGHPVLGDPLYGFPNMPKAPRLMLHACYLGFRHPESGQQLSFFAPPDPVFRAPDEAELLKAIETQA